MIRPKRDKSVIVSPIITRNQTAVCLSPRLHNSLHPLSGTMKKSINYHCVRKRQDLSICSSSVCLLRAHLRTVHSLAARHPAENGGQKRGGHPHWFNTTSWSYPRLSKQLQEDSPSSADLPQPIVKRRIFWVRPTTLTDIGVTRGTK